MLPLVQLARKLAKCLHQHTNSFIMSISTDIIAISLFVTFTDSVKFTGSKSKIQTTEKRVKYDQS